MWAQFMAGIMDPLIKAVGSMLLLVAAWAAWKAKQYFAGLTRNAARDELTDVAKDAAAFVENHVVRRLKDPRTPEVWDIDAERHARDLAKNLTSRSGEHALKILAPKDPDQLIAAKVERAVCELRAAGASVAPPAMVGGVRVDPGGSAPAEPPRTPTPPLTRPLDPGSLENDPPTRPTIMARRVPLEPAVRPAMGPLPTAPPRRATPPALPPRKT